MSINSRLELPAEQTRRQQFQQSSLTSSRVTSGFASPEVMRTPLATRTAGSLEEYFGIPLRVMTDLGSGERVGKGVRKGSGSTTSSGGFGSPRQG